MGWPKPPEPPYRFYDHAVERMNQRGISRTEIQDALERPVDVVRQTNGNDLFVGRNGVGVVVDGATGEIVTVLHGWR